MGQGSESHDVETDTDGRTNDAAPVALESHLGYQLKHLQTALRSRMDETLRPLGLTTPQYNCLEQLRRRPGASNSELARGAFVTRQTMNTLLRGMQDRELVTRPVKADSGRVLPTRLTPAGERLLDRAASRVEAISDRMVSPLDEETRTMVTEALGLCIAALEAPENG
ncbi:MULTISPECIES: MarR family winged helix-turn-helix transcriptional regulator [unclassified Brevibacterium]|jgi:DNA-binding MarR family transcriptional regulator|uniref:MarR family winged helix-turn-helix transcriptional regulator n=1 Tax=unclassified Brevibacterium TaxID=2614124 RepID=UPI0010818BE2|nr:MarR family transcriptional regulator [Brevibacterium sp. S111]TGD12912.1 MarR family transcriptional regulator [Brevibacterium sp. S111]